MHHQLLSGAVAAFAVAGAANGTTIIDTTGSWGGARTAVWDHVGQEFEVPATDNALGTFEIGVGGAAGSYTFSIFEWDSASARTVGGALFATGSLAIPDASVEFVTFVVDTALVPGELYAAVVSFDGNPDGGVGRGVAFMSGDHYTNGDVVFTELPVDEPWESGSPTGFDLGFRAVFTPAPGALALFGLAALMGTRRNRRS